MDDCELEVTWKGKKAKLVLREEGDEIKGYVGGQKHALTLAYDEDDELNETFCHDDLEYDEEELEDLLADDEEGEDEEDEDEEDEDEESEGEEGEDEEEDPNAVDEDEDADYGEPVKTANIRGAPTLHAVLVAYGAGIGVDDDIRLMRDFFRTLQAEKVINVRELLLSGKDATAEKALAAVKGLCLLYTSDAADE